MNYPLQIRFKILALAAQTYVEDAQGNTVCYVRQKMFKLKEDIQIFSDSSKSRQIGSIRANKVIDWSARYTFRDAADAETGSVGRQGMKSLWRARYDCFDPGSEVPAFHIQEENPWTKVMDGLVGGIPLVGFLSGFMFHPTYLATRPDGTPAMRVTKRPAFFEGKFTVEKLTELTPQEEVNLVYSFFMLLLLERSRG